MMADEKDYARDYTHPQLRQRLKEHLKAQDKGGAPGQWSARKSQPLKHEYEKHGGGYRNPEHPSAAQRELAEWTDERWQTESGSAHARRGGETERYLPERAWEELSHEERWKTEHVKRDQSRRGQQYVSNPPAAKRARRLAELDALTAREAAKWVRGLSTRDAEEALRHEREHKSRKTVLHQLEKIVKRS